MQHPGESLGFFPEFFAHGLLLLPVFPAALQLGLLFFTSHFLDVIYKHGIDQSDGLEGEYIVKVRDRGSGFPLLGLALDSLFSPVRHIQFPLPYLTLLLCRMEIRIASSL